MICESILRNIQIKTGNEIPELFFKFTKPIAVKI